MPDKFRPRQRIMASWSLGDDIPCPDSLDKIKSVASHAETTVRWFKDHLPVEGIPDLFGVELAGGGWFTWEHGWQRMIQLQKQFTLLGYESPETYLSFAFPMHFDVLLMQEVTAALNRLGASVHALMKWVKSTTALLQLRSAA